VATEIVLPEYREVRRADEAEQEAAPMALGGYDSVEEAEEMRRRLRELGYLD
jgi:hypothetical protein